jgi:hypothetical protein
LISGLAPTVANGYFGEHAGANANNLTKPGIPCPIIADASPHATNVEVCGNDGMTGSLLVYTLSVAADGQNITKIQVFGGWQDAGRNAQDQALSAPYAFSLDAQVVNRAECCWMETHPAPQLAAGTSCSGLRGENSR